MPKLANKENQGRRALAGPCEHVGWGITSARDGVSRVLALPHEHLALEKPKNRSWVFFWPWPLQPIGERLPIGTASTPHSRLALDTSCQSNNYFFTIRLLPWLIFESIKSSLFVETTHTPSLNKEIPTLINQKAIFKRLVKDPFRAFLNNQPWVEVRRWDGLRVHHLINPCSKSKKEALKAFKGPLRASCLLCECHLQALYIGVNQQDHLAYLEAKHHILICINYYLRTSVGDTGRGAHAGNTGCLSIPPSKTLEGIHVYRSMSSKFHWFPCSSC